MRKYFTDRTELYHHGVLGQKWGVRRYQNYDGTRIKNGIPVTKTNSLLGEYGGVYYSQISYCKGITSIYDTAIDSLSAKRKIHKSSKDYLSMSDLEKDATIMSINSKRGSNNCQICTASYDMLRRTGYIFEMRNDPEADNIFHKNDEIMYKLYKGFSGFKPVYDMESAKGLSEYLSKQFGNEEVWGRVNLKTKSGGGHAVSFYLQNGKTRFVDSRNRVDLSAEDFDNKLGKYVDWDLSEYCRTDNLKLNDGAVKWLSRLTQSK